MVLINSAMLPLPLFYRLKLDPYSIIFPRANAPCGTSAFHQ